MQNGPNGMATNMDQMLPLLLLDDGNTDLKSLLLMTTMMQSNCEDTNNQMMRRHFGRVSTAEETKRTLLSKILISVIAFGLAEVVLAPKKCDQPPDVSRVQVQRDKYPLKKSLWVLCV